MTRIGILSDTHSYLDPAVFEYFSTCDELWHAGDWGRTVAEPLMAFKPIRGVYGNIDGDPVRKLFKEDLKFNCEEVKVFITHIGGYPGRYEPRVKPLLDQLKPDLFICGHSHILKIIRDPKLNNMLHINPGAAGKTGLHQVRTMVQLKIEGKKIFDVEVIELGKR
jgi:putative phosphoesterase